VLPDGQWSQRLAADLACQPSTVAGVQGKVRVPLRSDRPPTDWERHVSGLQDARFATADMAYRRTALVASGGFDERFRRAYREDAELALRLRRAGWGIERGRREVLHSVRAAGPLVSLRLQAGNADDVLMHALHGRHWRRDACAARGRFRRHLMVVAAGAGSALLFILGRPAAARVAALGWLAGVGELAGARIIAGPRTAQEIAKMLATSVLLPFWAVAHRAAGWVRVARLARGDGCAARATQAPPQALRRRARASRGPPGA
jgi:hypothetical protein